MTHRLVCVIASGPGAGKTTLAMGLADDLSRAGVAAWWWSEHALVERPAFARCGAALEANDQDVADLFLGAARDLVLARPPGETWVVDSLLPGFYFLLGRLPFARVERYRDEVAGVFAPLDPLLVYLAGDPAVSLERARTRSGDAFVERLLASFGAIALPEYPAGSVRDLDSRRRFFGWVDARTLALLAGWPGPTLVLDAAALSPADLRAAALTALTRAA